MSKHYGVHHSEHTTSLIKTVAIQALIVLFTVVAVFSCEANAKEVVSPALVKHNAICLVYAQYAEVPDSDLVVYTSRVNVHNEVSIDSTHFMGLAEGLMIASIEYNLRLFNGDRQATTLVVAAKYLKTNNCNTLLSI
jgi:hypothetical protein